MRNILSLTILAFTTVVSAQNMPLSLKLYSNFDFQSRVTNSEIEGTDLTSNSIRSAELFRMSAALVLPTKNGDFYEIELSEIGIKEVEDESRQTNINTGATVVTAGSKRTEYFMRMRAERNFLINKKGEKWKLYAGAGPDLYYERLSQIPNSSNSFPSKNTEVGLNIYVIPRLTFAISELWSLDLNIPVSLMNVNTVFAHIRNPQFTEQQQRHSYWNLNTGPQNFAMRLGIARRL